jgi:ferrous iron transport protein A
MVLTRDHQKEGATHMPLTLVGEGESVCIKRISGKDDTIRFLNRLGFIEGEQISIVSRMGGNLIINVKDTRVAIDRTLANRIAV